MRCSLFRTSWRGIPVVFAAIGVVVTVSGVGSRSLDAQQTSPFQTKEPGPELYDHYQPYECVAAMNRVLQVSRRKQDDTLQFMEPADTAPAPVRLVAQQCGAHFSISEVPSQQLLALFVTYLTAQDSVRANAVLQRLTSPGRTPAARADLLAQTIGAFDLVPVVPAGYITRLTAQVDTIRGAASARVTMHYALALYYTLLNATKDSLATRHLRAVLDAGRELDSAGRARVGDQVENARQLVPYLRILADDSTSRGSARVMQGTLLAGSPGTRPKPGRVTLMVFQQGTTRASVAALHRLKAKFGDALEIVFGGKTLGYFKMQGPLTLEAESALLRDYYTRELQVPGSVFLEQTPYTIRADGRVIPQPTANDQTYRDVAFLLVDASGIIRMSYGGWVPPVELRLERAIERTLRSH